MDEIIACNKDKNTYFALVHKFVVHKLVYQYFFS